MLSWCEVTKMVMVALGNHKDSEPTIKMLLKSPTNQLSAAV